MAALTTVATDGIGQDAAAPAPSPAASGSLLKSMLAVQAELPKLRKDETATVRSDKGSYSYGYISLESIVEIVGPILSRHKLVWTTLPGVHELSYRLMHAETGEALVGTMGLELGKPDMQGLGSALTYARRYALTAVLNLVADEDDDGQASQPAQQQARSDGVNLREEAKGLSDDQINAALNKAGLNPHSKPFGPLGSVPEEYAEKLREQLLLQQQMNA